MRGKRIQPYLASDGVLYVRVPKVLLLQLDAYMLALQKEMMPRRVRLTRSDAVRNLLSFALDNLK